MKEKQKTQRHMIEYDAIALIWAFQLHAVILVSNKLAMANKISVNFSRIICLH